MNTPKQKRIVLDNDGELLESALTESELKQSKLQDQTISSRNIQQGNDLYFFRLLGRAVVLLGVILGFVSFAKNPSALCIVPLVMLLMRLYWNSFIVKKEKQK